MKTLGNGSINFSFFFIKPLTSQHQGPVVRQRTNIWDIYLWNSCTLTNMPKAVSFTASPWCHRGLGATQSSVWAQRSLALYFLIPLPVAVDPYWTFIMGCYLGHILLKAERAADSKDQEKCQERCISDNSTQLQPYFTPAKFPWFQPLALCNIRKVSKGQENVPNHVEVRNLEWARWKKSFSDLLWTDKSVQEIRWGGGELLTPPLPFGIEHISRQRGV